MQKSRKETAAESDIKHRRAFSSGLSSGNSENDFAEWNEIPQLDKLSHVVPQKMFLSEKLKDHYRTFIHAYQHITNNTHPEWFRC